MKGGFEMRGPLVAFGFALTLAACADDPGPGQGSTPSVATPTVSRPSAPAPPYLYPERWIAVIDVASDPSDLDALTQRMLDPLGTALMVAPTECFEGLPDAAGDGNLNGAEGDSRREVEGRVVDAGEEVAFVANVKIVCSD